MPARKFLISANSSPQMTNQWANPPSAPTSFSAPPLFCPQAPAHSQTKHRYRYPLEKFLATARPRVTMPSPVKSQEVLFRQLAPTTAPPLQSLLRPAHLFPFPLLTLPIHPPPPPYIPTFSLPLLSRFMILSPLSWSASRTWSGSLHL